MPVATKPKTRLFGPETPPGYAQDRAALAPATAPTGSPYGGLPAKAPLTQQSIGLAPPTLGTGMPSSSANDMAGRALGGVMNWNNRIGAQNRSQVGNAIQHTVDWNNRIGAQNRAQVANAIEGSQRLGGMAANGVNQANPTAPTTTMRSPSDTALGLASAAQGAGNAIGTAMSNGLNQVSPNAPVTTMRSPSEAAYGLVSGIGHNVAGLFGGAPSNSAAASPVPQRPPGPTPYGSPSGDFSVAPLEHRPGGGPLKFRGDSDMFDTEPGWNRPWNPTAPLKGISTPEAQVQQQAPPQQFAPPPSGVPFGPAVPPGGLHTPTLNSLGIGSDPNANMRNNLLAMQQQNKAVQQRMNANGPSYIQRQLAAQATPPPPPNLIGNLGLTAPPPAAQPLGGYAANQAGFDARMKAENPLGNFGGTLPVRGADGRVAFADGPMKDLGQKPQFGKDSGASYRFTSVDGPNGTQYIGNNTPEQQKARELFDSRRGGLAQRQSDYQARQAGERSERSSGVLAAAQARGANRAENVRLKRGQLSFDERLAMQDPQSAALKADANGRLGLAREQGAARIAAQKDTLAAQERMNEANNKTRLGIAQSNAAAKNPVEEKPKPYSDSDYKQMDPKEAAGHMIANGIPPAEVNRRMTAITGVDHNWVQQPNGPGLFTGAKPAQPVVTPPVGSPNRAKMAGGMQLPSNRSVFSKEYEKTQKRLDDPRLVSRSPK